MQNIIFLLYEVVSGLELYVQAYIIITFVKLISALLF